MRKLKSYAKKTAAEEKEINVSGIFLKSLGICFAISFILIIIYALILSFTSVSDSTMNLTIQVIMILSITISSIYEGKKIRRKGWLFGMALGLAFILLLTPLSMAFGLGFCLDKYFAAKALTGTVVGLIGGIIGVNLN
jgi:putative membrane protein (TIGR04086 family)